jgi:hypothetical protein
MYLIPLDMTDGGVWGIYVIAEYDVGISYVL